MESMKIKGYEIITPVVHYDEHTSEEAGKGFHFQGNYYQTRLFSRIPADTMLFLNGWEYFFSVHRGRAVVIRKYNDSDMLMVAMRDVPFVDMDSLVESVLFEKNCPY